MKSIQNLSLLFAILYTLDSVLRLNAMLPDTKAKTWSYEIKSIEQTTSDAELVDINLQVEMISRGVYSIGGTALVNLDMEEDDNNEIEVLAFRSDNGVNPYKLLPFKVTRMHYFKILNTFYKDCLLDTLKGCSDLPAFEDKFEPPFEKKTYTLTECQFSQDGFPNHLQEGFYKIEIKAYGSVEWILTVIAQVEKNS